jgi:hypothetical protein
MITITRNLPLVSFAGNPMKVTVQTNNTLGPGYVPRQFYTIFCKVRFAFYTDESTLFEETIIDSAEPDTEGNVTFDLSKIIKDKIAPTFQDPQSESNFFVKDYCVAKFYLSFADGYGIPFVVQAYQAEESELYAIPGGLSDWMLEELEADDSNAFTFLQEHEMFLTNQPANKIVKSGQPELLRFFNSLLTWQNEPVPTQNFILKLREFNLNGEEYISTITTGSFERLAMYSLNVTPGVIFTLNNGTDSWEIWLELSPREGYNYLSEVVSYKRDERKEPRSKYFIFQNSMGGFDSVAATGRIVSSLEGESSVNMLPVSTNLRSYFNINQDRAMCNRIFKGFIGLFSSDCLDWLQEFFRSEKRQYVGDKRLENVGLRISAFPIDSDLPVPSEVEIEAYIGIPDSFVTRIRTKRVCKIPLIPSLTTSVVSAITNISASCGGNISSDHNAPVTGRGVCWSTSPNPTINDSKTSNGTGEGAFTSAITGLLGGITYYVRAYATNSVGTAYGDDVSFTTAMQVGDEFQGGLIGYILQPGDNGYVAGEFHGIIAAPADQGSFNWDGGNNQNLSLSTAFGHGKNNTDSIVAAVGAGVYAAKTCDDLTIGSYSDWYLPTLDEMYKLYIHLAPLTFGTSAQFESGEYWTSSGINLTQAKSFDMNSSMDWDRIKSNNLFVRAIRSF